jgi:iron complex outermembrane receptor protein
MSMSYWYGRVVGMAMMAFAAVAEASEDGGITEIVVVGSRAAPRAVTESASAVDVIAGEQLRASGFNDLSKALQFIAPSVNFPRSATGPSAANTRGITLRGLSPDQVLVLIDGKRRHASSVLNFNNVVGRGTVPVDLNTIPVSAIERVEVLRDGAAAQYGSDAIAGVINIVLRKDRGADFATTQAGVTERGDGATGVVAASKSFALSPSGFVTATAESRYRDSTNSAGIDSRFGRVTNRQGDPESLDLDLVVNAGGDISDSTHLYGNVIAARRDSQSAAQYRAPSISTLYPNGFIPLIDLDMWDLAATVGLTHQVGAWQVDLSNTTGSNRADFSVTDTVNTSLGAGSPRKFDAGGTRYLQNLGALTATRTYDVLHELNLALGVENRYERFELKAGEPGSLAGAGAQGFPGFNPVRPVNESRTGNSAFIDVELKPSAWLNLGGAVRYENYSGFDDAVTGKLSVLAKPTELLALRATASTGFRAPSLQQQYFSTVSSQSSAGKLVNVGTFAVDDPAARALGAKPLDAETSRHISAGLVFTPADNLSLSADAFRIDIDDRIILSESLSGAAVQSVLLASNITNVSQARFFTNAADTRTEGFEVAMHSSLHWLNEAASRATLSYMRARTRLTAVKENDAIPTLPLLGLSSIDLLAKAQPEDKLTLTSSHQWRAWNLQLDATRFGSYRGVPVLAEQTFGAVTSVDIGIDYALLDTVRVSLGVLNATAAYPDKIAERALLQGGSLQYSESGGLGTDGREYYLRVTAEL